MTIATNNGSVILKSGSVAQNCGCCEGGIACCKDPSCLHLTHNVRFTVSRDVPAAYGNSDSIKLPETPYINSFVLPYATYGEIRNNSNIVTSQYRQWEADIDIEESCVQPRIEFRVTWGVTFQSIGFSYRFTYNRRQLQDGNASICEPRTMQHGELFAGLCGLPHYDASLFATVQSGLGFVSFDYNRIGRITADFIERE
jgi:hypothetical protein